MSGSSSADLRKNKWERKLNFFTLMTQQERNAVFQMRGVGEQARLPELDEALREYGIRYQKYRPQVFAVGIASTLATIATARHLFWPFPLKSRNTLACVLVPALVTSVFQFYSQNCAMDEMDDKIAKVLESPTVHERATSSALQQMIKKPEGRMA